MEAALQCLLEAVDSVPPVDSMDYTSSVESMDVTPFMDAARDAVPSVEPSTSGDDSCSSGGPSASPGCSSDNVSDHKSSGDGEPGANEPRRSKRLSNREYNLRDSSLINRIQTERRRAQPKAPKPKAKPPPLSKYRRRTANARERTRMKEINDAYDLLRRSIPQHLEPEPEPEPEPKEPAGGTKLTKITTLRLAMNYIIALREMLGYDDMCLELRSYSSGSDMTCSSPESSHGGNDLINSFPSFDTSSDEGKLSPLGLDSEGEPLT